MSDDLKQSLIQNDCKEHVDEFGNCIGIVEDLVNYNNGGENDSSKIGPEVNVRWMPSKLRYGYAPIDLVKLEDREEIISIADKLKKDEINTDEAQELLLRLFGTTKVDCNCENYEWCNGPYKLCRDCGRTKR
jgi:hypothetical protein